MFNILLFSNALVIWLIIWGISRGLDKEKNRMVLRIKLPEHGFYNDEVIDILYRYKKKRLQMIILTLCLMLPLLIPTKYVSITFSVFMIWMFSMIFLSTWVFAKHEGELKKLKRNNGWYEASSNIITVDTDLSKLKTSKFPNKIHFIIPFIISFLPFLMINKLVSPILIIAISLFCLLMGLAVILIINKSPNKVYSDDTSISTLINTDIKRRWIFTVIFLMYFTSLINTIVYYFLNNLPQSYIVTIALALSTLIPIAIILIIHKLNEQTLSTYNISRLEEDELSWIFGEFYYNPRLNKTFVNKRYGIGSTVNIASTGGKIFIISTALLLLLILIPIWVHIVLEDFIPHEAIVTSETITFKSSWYKTEININDIDKIDIIGSSDFLKNGYKINGGSTDIYRRGLFYYSDLGDCEMYVYNDSTPFLVIYTSEKTIVYSGIDNKETEKLESFIRNTIK